MPQPSRVDAPIDFPAPAISGTAPDADYRVNLGADIRSRLGVDVSSHPPAIGQHEHSAAIQVEGHIRGGDAGAVRRFVHELEYQLGPFRPSPWRLIEHLADRAIGRLQETAPAAPSGEGTPAA
jgi:hypothetical protein